MSGPRAYSGASQQPEPWPPCWGGSRHPPSCTQQAGEAAASPDLGPRMRGLGSAIFLATGRGLARQAGGTPPSAGPLSLNVVTCSRDVRFSPPGGVPLGYPVSTRTSQACWMALPESHTHPALKFFFTAPDRKPEQIAPPPTRSWGPPAPQCLRSPRFHLPHPSPTCHLSGLLGLN